MSTTKKSHRNDRRRLTARERAKAFASEWVAPFVVSKATAEQATLTLTRALEAHAAATLARAKRRAGR